MSKDGKKNKIRKKEKIIVGLMSSTILGVGVTIGNVKIEEKVEENEKEKKKKKPTKLIVKEWSTNMKRI